MQSVTLKKHSPNLINESILQLPLPLRLFLNLLRVDVLSLLMKKHPRRLIRGAIIRDEIPRISCFIYTRPFNEASVDSVCILQFLIRQNIFLGQLSMCSDFYQPFHYLPSLVSFNQVQIKTRRKQEVMSLLNQGVFIDTFRI